jgi:hypothetical protein
MMTHTTTTIEHIRKHLAVARRAKRSIFFLSSPGLGKTSEIGAFAVSIKADLHVMVASLLDRIDLSGIPHVTNVKFGEQTEMRVTKFAPMELMANLSNEANPNGKPAVLYFNEVNSAPETVQATLLRIFNERAIGDLTLRDNVMLVADGNPASSMSIGRDLPMAMRRRFSWVCIAAALAPWKKWGLENNVDGRVLSFFEVQAFAGHFSNFDPKKRENLTYACPASWTQLSSALQAMEAVEREEGLRFSDEDRLVNFTGEVGMEAGAAFAGYLKFAAKIPNAKEVLDNPEGAKLPDDTQMRALLVGSVVNLVREKSDYVNPAMVLAQRMFDRKTSDTPEYGVFLARALATIPSLSAKVQRSPGFKAMAEILLKEKELLVALSSKPSGAK